MAITEISTESEPHYRDGIDDSVVPGTVHLIDLDLKLQGKHSKAQQDVVLGMALISPNVNMQSAHVVAL